MGNWEVVCVEELRRVRRFAVPGGWLYQVELDWRAEPGVVGDPQVTHVGWGVPVFVPHGGRP